MVIEELYAERDFLFERSMQAGICRFDQDRFTGISSNALVRFAFTGEEPEVNGRDWRYPSDASDLAACEHTYAMAPAHLQPRMLPLLEKYRAHIQAKAEEQARRREGAA